MKFKTLIFFLSVCFLISASLSRASEENEEERNFVYTPIFRDGSPMPEKMEEKSQEKGPFLFLKLDPELQKITLSFLGPKELLSLQQTCKSLFKLSRDSSFFWYKDFTKAKSILYSPLPLKEFQEKLSKAKYGGFQFNCLVRSPSSKIFDDLLASGRWNTKLFLQQDLGQLILTYRETRSKAWEQASLRDLERAFIREVPMTGRKILDKIEEDLLEWFKPLLFLFHGQEFNQRFSDELFETEEYPAKFKVVWFLKRWIPNYSPFSQFDGFFKRSLDTEGTTRPNMQKTTELWFQIGAEFGDKNAQEYLAKIQALNLKEAKDFFSDVPDELILFILSHLPFQDYMTLQKVSKRFHALAQDSSLKWTKNYDEGKNKILTSVSAEELQKDFQASKYGYDQFERIMRKLSTNEEDLQRLSVSQDPIHKVWLVTDASLEILLMKGLFCPPEKREKIWEETPAEDLKEVLLTWSPFGMQRQLVFEDKPLLDWLQPLQNLPGQLRKITDESSLLPNYIAQFKALYLLQECNASKPNKVDIHRLFNSLFSFFTRSVNVSINTSQQFKEIQGLWFEIGHEFGDKRATDWLEQLEACERENLD